MSEETEVKKDLKEAILGIEITQFDGQKADLEELVNPKQLEEIISDWMPEVLSQKWIDENKVARIDDLRKMTTSDVVTVEKLKNLLVPKQDKAVIPQFLADWIEVSKKHYSIGAVFHDAYDGKLAKVAIEEYIFENQDLFAQAWLDGYEVEKEKKYYVLDYEDIPLLERANNQACKTTTALSIYEDGRDNSRFALTEKEIKDYDERFWQFAVPVEEEAE